MITAKPASLLMWGLLVLSQCLAHPGAGMSVQDDYDDPGEERALTGVAQFTTEVYQMMRGVMRGSFVTCPICTIWNVAMLLLGSKDLTLVQLNSALHFNHDLDQFKIGTQEFREFLEDNSNSVSAASGMFPSNSLSLKRGFVSDAGTYLNAAVHAVDYNKGDEAATAINQWALERTNSTIGNLINASELRASMNMLLINIAYFKGKFETKFEMTQPKNFFVKQTLRKKVTMMKTNVETLYGDYEDLESRVIQLDFDEIGLVNIFLDPDFSGIIDTTSKGVKVDSVIQKVTLNINEEGSEEEEEEELQDTSSEPDKSEIKKIEFRANHPFLFVIRDTVHNMVFLVGRYTGPSDYHWLYSATSSNGLPLKV
uniref:Serpin domain-containing protein n=1 Tax=Timema cristinae TaxID=61476 RepID=A0A7R9GTJ2_TIMCR|nr:unnamed protein product [Timema cristinae]